MLDWLLMHSPSWLQAIFFERVVRIVKKEWQKEANKVLQPEKKKSLLARRRHKSPGLV